MARQVIVSSNNFKPWMTRKDAILCHNVDVNQIEKYIDLPKKTSHASPLSIVFAGMMIEGPINIKLLDRFKTDERYQFHYIGRENEQKEDIAKFVKETGMKNVFFQGAYNKDEIVDIYRGKADLVNILREKTVVNKNALPNKLYDALVSGVPIVVFEHNEAIVSYVKKYNLGLVLDENLENINDVILEKMGSFDYSAFGKGCNDFLNEVLNDMALFKKTVLDFAD